MKQKIKAILASTLVVAVSGPAFAGTATANLQITATVNPTCTLSAANLDIGAFTPNATAGTLGTGGTISALCSHTLPYTILLGTGSGTYAQRTMTGTSGNTDKLNYKLYSNESPSTVWGDGSAGTTTVASTGTGSTQYHQVNIDVPMNQFIKPDNYSDSVTITVNY